MDSRTLSRKPEELRHKGRRYCFIAAMIGPDLNTAPESRRKSQLAQLITESVDIFEGGKKSRNSDYHTAFNHEYFCKLDGGEESVHA